jgi:hypothetical protein
MQQARLRTASRTSLSTQHTGTAPLRPAHASALTLVHTWCTTLNRRTASRSSHHS